ncbi:MAG TPA: TIGR03067 domain-containing protein [Urbifossiella sp.]|nr:TIGR03067 domain-containing protein [Urbifossiella sp.]
MPPRRLVTLTVCLLAAGTARGDAPTDVQALQGKWELVALEMFGEKFTGEHIAGITWTFQGDKLIPGERGRTRDAWAYKLDPTRSPKEIDLRRDDKAEAEADPGIYVLEGDTLRVAMGKGFKKTRPKDLTPGKDPVELLVFMRPAAAAAMRAEKARQTAAAAETDTAALQGEWTVVSVEHQGQVITEVAKRGLKSFIFDGSKVIQAGEDGRTSAATYTLDPLQMPKAIDLTLLDAPPKARPMPGVYRLEGDTLRLCINEHGQGRPPDFQTTGRDKLITYVLERPKAPPIVTEPPPGEPEKFPVGTTAAVVGGVVLVTVAVLVALRLRRAPAGEG